VSALSEVDLAKIRYALEHVDETYEQQAMARAGWYMDFVIGSAKWVEHAYRYDIVVEVRVRERYDFATDNMHFPPARLRYAIVEQETMSFSAHVFVRMPDAKGFVRDALMLTLRHLSKRAPATWWKHHRLPVRGLLPEHAEDEHAVDGVTWDWPWFP
jgi:hypothetical protein